MKMLQAVDESNGQMRMTTYLVPDDWRPSPDWPVAASMVMPLNEATTGAALDVVKRVGALVEVDGVVWGGTTPGEGDGG